MTTDVDSGISPCAAVWMPVSRGRAVTRGIFLAIPALLLALAAKLALERVSLAPSGISSRWVDFSLGLLGLFAMLAALACAVPAARWLALGLWPARVGVSATETWLAFRLGPFGTRLFAANELVVRYPYEEDDDEIEDAGFEAYLPEEQQRRVLLPDIRHRRSSEPLQELIRRFAPGTEAELAAALRPMIDRWKSVAEKKAQSV